MSADEAAPPPEVGSLAEEATALLGALSGWVLDNAGTVGARAAGTQPGEREPSQEATAPADGDAAEPRVHEGTCRGCPVCRVLSAARRPEVRQHLLDAGTSLLAAFAALLETPVPEAGASTTPPGDAADATRRVTRIPVDADPASENPAPDIPAPESPAPEGRAQA